MRAFFVRIGALAGATLVCCRNSEAPPVVPGPPYALQVVSGDSQYGTVHEALALPIRVRLLDPAGHPSPGQLLRFTAANGGAPGLPVAETDSAGEALVVWILGTVAGPQSFTISTDSSVPTTPVSVQVSATGLAGPPIYMYFSKHLAHILGDSIWTTSFVSSDQYQNRAPPASPVKDLDHLGTTRETDSTFSVIASRPGKFRFVVAGDTAVVAILAPVKTLRLAQYLGDTVETMTGQLALETWGVAGGEPPADTDCYFLSLNNAVATYAVGGAPPDSARFAHLPTMLYECIDGAVGLQPVFSIHKVAWPAGTYDSSDWLQIAFTSTDSTRWLARGEQVVNSVVVFGSQDSLVIR